MHSRKRRAHSRRRPARRGVLWGAGIFALGSLAGLLAISIPSGAGALSLVLQPRRVVSSAPQGAVAAAAGWESSNWSGYAETSSSPYTSVSGQWTVPTVTGPNGSYSAAWVGIDGFNNSSLIQTGTEQDYSNGSGQYSAWWTTSSQDFAEQTISSGCSTSAGSQSGTANVAVATQKVAAAPAVHAAPRGFGSSPSATTGSASNITSSAATLNGTVNPNGSGTYYYFEYGTTRSYGAETPTVYAGSGSTTIAVSANLTGLSSSTTYHFQLVAYSRRTVDGGDSSFTTAAASGSGGGGSSCGAVAPGDVMSATISQTSASTSTWTITITDTSSTHGWTFTKSVDYTGPGSSAEWILEAPSLCSATRCTVATLADYASTVFDQGTANGGNPKLVASESGEIVNSRGQVISIPSNPDSDTDGFTVAYGPTAPSPPNS